MWGFVYLTMFLTQLLLLINANPISDFIRFIPSETAKSGIMVMGVK